MTHRRPIALPASSCWGRRPEARTGSLRMPVRTSGRGRGASSERRRAERGESRERDLRRADPRLHPPPPPRGAAGARAQCRRLLADLRCAGRLAAELHAADGHRAGGGARAGLEPGGDAGHGAPRARSCWRPPSWCACARPRRRAWRCSSSSSRTTPTCSAPGSSSVSAWPWPRAGCRRASPRPVSAPSQRRSARSCASTTRLASRPPSIRSGDSQSGACGRASSPSRASRGSRCTAAPPREWRSGPMRRRCSVTASPCPRWSRRSAAPGRASSPSASRTWARSASRSAPRASSRSTISTPSATR